MSVRRGCQCQCPSPSSSSPPSPSPSHPSALKKTAIAITLFDRVTFCLESGFEAPPPPQPPPGIKDCWTRMRIERGEGEERGEGGLQKMIHLRCRKWCHFRLFSKGRNRQRRQKRKNNDDDGAARPFENGKFCSCRIGHPSPQQLQEHEQRQPLFFQKLPV